MNILICACFLYLQRAGTVLCWRQQKPINVAVPVLSTNVCFAGMVWNCRMHACANASCAKQPLDSFY